MTLPKSSRGVYERKISENDVLGAIRQLLELNGFRVWRIVERIPWGRTKSEPGIPDLAGYFRHGFTCHSGKDCRPLWIQIPFYIEVKKPGGKLRPAQEAWLARANEDGVIAFKAESVEECVSEFKKYGIEIKGL